jgi:hypothetical protein
VASNKLHERTGFRALGDIVSLGVSGARLVSWRGDGGTRTWLQRRDGSTVLTLPPVPRQTNGYRPVAAPGSDPRGGNGSPRHEPGR